MYAEPSIGPTPAEAALIEGAIAAHVEGAGAYAWINRFVYVE